MMRPIRVQSPCKGLGFICFADISEKANTSVNSLDLRD